MLQCIGIEVYLEILRKFFWLEQTGWNSSVSRIFYSQNHSISAGLKVAKNTKLSTLEQHYVQ